MKLSLSKRKCLAINLSGLIIFDKYIDTGFDYGCWLIYKDTKAKYWLNLFDDDFEPLRLHFDQRKLDYEQCIKEMVTISEEPQLSLVQMKGLQLALEGESLVEVEVEKFPMIYGSKYIVTL